MCDSDQRRRISDACRLANDLALDLTNGMEAYRTLQMLVESQRFAQPVKVGITRICLFHIIITLSKWIEFYERYKAVIPSEIQDPARKLHNEVAERGIREFRNKVVGHIWDKETKRPLTNAEVEQRVDEITRGDVTGFMKWVSDPEDGSSHTAVGVIEGVKNALRKRYQLTDEEVGAWHAA